MMKFQWVFNLALSAACFVAIHSVALAQVNVPYVASPGVTIDGVVRPDEWSGAFSSREVFLSWNGGSSIACAVHLIHDGDYLYVGMETPLRSGWDSKGRLRIDGRDFEVLNGSASYPHFDIQSEVGAPGAWIGYTNYMALISASQAIHVVPGSGEQRASAGSSAVSYEFKMPLEDLAATVGSTIRLILTASSDSTQMWSWPAVDIGAGNPATWMGLTLQSPIQNYCGPAHTNSSGLAGVISGGGSTDVATNCFLVVAEQLPVNQFGYFITSQVQGYVAHPGGSQGSLCVDGAMGLHGRFLETQFSGESGSFGLVLDLGNLPTRFGAHAVAPGETWNFQGWYRDQNPGNTSNFTDGLSVTFR